MAMLNTIRKPDSKEFGVDQAEYAKQMSASGWNVVQSGGAWWFNVKPFFYIPVHIMEPLEKGSAPPALKSFLGYQHVVPDERDANCHLPFMILKNNHYDMGLLSSDTRNRVRKGLKNLEIRPLKDINEMLEMGIEINRSAIPRQKRQSNHSRLTDYKKWVTNIKATFGKEGWEEWGAYKDGRLVAYLRGLLIEDTLYLEQSCGHADFLKFYPNNALYHCFLESLKGRDFIKQTVNSYEVSKESLNEFKRQFGFETVRTPAYRWINPPLKAVLQFTRYRYYLQQWK